MIVFTAGSLKVKPFHIWSPPNSLCKWKYPNIVTHLFVAMSLGRAAPAPVVTPPLRAPPMRALTVLLTRTEPFVPEREPFVVPAEPERTADEYEDYGADQPAAGRAQGPAQ